MSAIEPLPVINPYQGKGSLEEAWRKGFQGGRRLAHPTSNYGKVYAMGREARKAWDQANAPKR